MPTAADHFATFVDGLAADPSPSRLGRVARSVAGESPARFRGRILLERAAWLMLTTDRTLLDIALDSGFRSQDAFARAFRREHGVLPSVWRAEPTSCSIDAPNDVHFHPPAGLRLPARGSDPGDLVVTMAQAHADLVGELVDRGADVGVLVARMEAFVALATGLPREPACSPRSRFDDVRAAYVDAVALVTATGRLDETYVDAFAPEPAPMSLGAMVTRDLMDTDRLRT